MRAHYWLVITALALASVVAVNAKPTYKCGFGWRVPGKVLYQGTLTPEACEAKCSSLPGCQFFYTTEDSNSQNIISCFAMGSVSSKGTRDDKVMVVCALPTVWPRLEVSAECTGDFGSFIPPVGAGALVTYKHSGLYYQQYLEL
jgi:hypothetical protein